MVVEELLQLLISEVDAQLLKRVELQWENTVEQLEPALTPTTYYYSHREQWQYSHQRSHTHHVLLLT